MEKYWCRHPLHIFVKLTREPPLQDTEYWEISDITITNNQMMNINFSLFQPIWFLTLQILHNICCLSLVSTFAVTSACLVVVAEGKWCEWEPSAECSTTCGPGTQELRRKCDCPPPGPGGKDCPGPGTKTEGCNIKQCPGGCINKLNRFLNCNNEYK